MAFAGVGPVQSLTGERPLRGVSYQVQDLFVLDVLSGLRGGFFLDSGASDGVHGSNTLLLEELFDWRGICVEPNAALFAKLSSTRRAMCVNTCLDQRPGDVEFFEAAGVLGGIVTQYDPGLLSYARSLAGPNARPVVKSARTIRSVLRECEAPQVIDYWSLDIEGAELAILTSFPFEEYSVRVLTVEHNYTPARSAIRRFLESRGFRQVRALGIDDGYVLQDSLLKRPWRSRVWSQGLPGR